MNHRVMGAAVAGLLSLGLFLTFAETGVAGERVVFSFSPATGDEIAYTTQVTHHYDIPGKKSVQRTTTTQALKVEKADGAGSRVKVAIGEHRYEEDGAIKPVSAISAMTGISGSPSARTGKFLEWTACPNWRRAFRTLLRTRESVT